MFLGTPFKRDALKNDLQGEASLGNVVCCPKPPVCVCLCVGWSVCPLCAKVLKAARSPAGEKPS